MIYWESKESFFLFLYNLFKFLNFTGSILISLAFMIFYLSLWVYFVDYWDDDGHMNDFYELRLPFWAFWLFFQFFCFNFRSKLFKGWDTVEIYDFIFLCFMSSLVRHLLVYYFFSFLLKIILLLFNLKFDYYELLVWDFSIFDLFLFSISFYFLWSHSLVSDLLD